MSSGSVTLEQLHVSLRFLSIGQRLVVPNSTIPLVLADLGGNFVLLCKRLINHGRKIRINLAGHDLLKGFLVAIVNLTRFTSGLQPVDQETNTHVGWLILTMTHSR